MSPVWLGSDYVVFTRNMPQRLCHRDHLEKHGRDYDGDCRNMLDVNSNTYSIRPSATSTESWWATELCAWGPPTDAATSYTYTSIGTDGRETSKPGTMRSPGSFNAYGVEVRWQSTDFTSPPATRAVTTTQATPAETQSSTGDSSSLSTGAKVGIGLGVTAGVVLATALALGLLWSRRRRRQQPNATHDQPGNSDYSELAELPGTRHRPLTYEKAELPADSARSQTRRFELDGERST
ncbi:hypothetical protein IFM58399_09060 [Aspergillus lentulus]|uniref:Mid2 domain-containing protein n=1 Tax=Aspergillus lentulus TaxID=293939 RepID=A0AAN5YVD2_ASPLE|nr:uncharacterized protein IFM58399_09060 [Aspergillus lentulus]KAF4160351.1 hypothetical protein CNMCM6069_008701 [Aspergillus lentulus]KAF4169643.1 hypothetical protein CNMCM6936_006802 [Aspergillus lentulus]KAF4181132.1 hypothetical protein CNMCM8060_009778 [Aspergillus lentulus]KAF4187672.1 hypothetical protein CNMCM7927_003618 [Aspergillus lentulus]KAF4194438.1 hypothetical protein CNMCM8694_007616 [Aspergillus lentulus]